MPELPQLAVEAAIEKTVSRYFESPDQFSFELADLQLRVYLSGPRWAGLVDKPVAKFLLDLDKVLTDQLAEVGIKFPESPHGLVALKIEEGSLDAVLQYSKGILKQIRKMNPQTQFMILVGVLGSLGLLNAPKIIGELQKDDIRKIDAEERVEIIRAVGEIVDNERELQRPLRGLINKMSEEDMIVLPSNPEPLNKKNAKQSLPKATRSKVKTFYVDHPYIVQELRTPKPDEWKVGLVFGDQVFTAELSLTETEIQELLESFQLAHESGSMIAPPMHVNMRVNANGVRSAVVVGLGRPREKSMKLSDALKAGAAQELDSDGEGGED